MATRFYIPSSGSVPFSPSYSDGSWTADSSAHIFVPAPRTKSNTSLTTLAGILASGTTTYTRYVTAISDPLDSAQTISGNVTGAIGKCLEASNSEDASFGIRVRVVNSSGTHLAQLHSTVSGTEFSSSTASSRTRSSVAISSYAAAAGDRIVVEFGVTGLTPACAGNVQFNVGDPSGVSDFNLTAGNTNDYCGWLELSCDLTFTDGGSSSSLSLAATDGADVCAGSADLEVGVSLAAIEGADVCACGVGLEVGVSLAAIEGADTASASMALQMSMALTATEGADTASANMAALSVSSLNATEGADVASSSVSLFVTASMATTEGADTLSASLELAGSSVSLSMAATEGADSAFAAVDHEVSQSGAGGSTWAMTPRTREEWEAEQAREMVHEVTEPAAVPHRATEPIPVSIKINPNAFTEGTEGQEAKPVPIQGAAVEPVLEPLQVIVEPIPVTDEELATVALLLTTRANSYRRLRTGLTMPLAA